MEESRVVGVGIATQVQHTEELKSFFVVLLDLARPVGFGVLYRRLDYTCSLVFVSGNGVSFVCCIVAGLIP